MKYLTLIAAFLAGVGCAATQLTEEDYFQAEVDGKIRFYQTNIIEPLIAEYGVEVAREKALNQNMLMASCSAFAMSETISDYKEGLMWYETEFEFLQERHDQMYRLHKEMGYFAYARQYAFQEQLAATETVTDHDDGTVTITSLPVGLIDLGAESFIQEQKEQFMDVARHFYELGNKPFDDEDGDVFDSDYGIWSSNCGSLESWLDNIGYHISNPSSLDESREWSKRWPDNIDLEGG